MVDIGPELPPGFKSKRNNSSDDEEDGLDTAIGPALPPHLQKKKQQQDVAGPALPPGYKASAGSSESEDSDSDSGSSSDSSDDEGKSRKRKSASQPSASGSKKAKYAGIGPSLPAGFQPVDQPPPADSDSDDDDGGIGPMPFTGDPNDLEMSEAHLMEIRARKMKDKLLNKTAVDVTSRESWMTELPAAVNKTMGMNLEARQFSRSQNKTTQDKSWTETPGDKAKREQAEREGKKPAEKDKYKIQSSRDKEIETQVEELNKNRNLSLYEMHQQKLHKKEKKKKDKKKKSKKEKKKDKKKEKEKDKKKEKKKEVKERRPFSREEDLKVNKFDDAMRKQMVKKSAELNTKFGHGGQKFI